MSKKNTLILYIVLFIFLFSCSDSNKKENGKLNITVSTAPYKYLVEKIGGDYVEVYSAIPQGADPHHFEPEPRTIQQIESSDCYFLVNGSFSFEKVLFEKMISIEDSLKSIDLSEGIDLIGNDPHVWLSIRNLKVISRNILSGLESLQPAQSEVFNSNYQKLVDSLDIVDGILTETIKRTQFKYLVVNHSAWKYFSRDYNLEEIAVQYGSKVTNAKDLAEYIDFVKSHDIRFILSSPEHSQHAIEVIAEQVGINTEAIDPLTNNLVKEFIKFNNIIEKYYESN